MERLIVKEDCLTRSKALEKSKKKRDVGVGGAPRSSQRTPPRMNKEEIQVTSGR